uniref:DUF6537 domain-containing protein n=1 Tax=Reyranella sp. TaxID=1929291 RepID=UPI0037844BB0
RAAHDRAAVEKLIAPADDKVVPFARPSKTLDELVAARIEHLTKYQDAALAERYRALVDKVRAAEHKTGETGLALAAARNYAKLLAYKDEYEVARLYSDSAFQAAIKRQFEGDYTIRFHLAPPLLASRDPKTGHLVKHAFGPWMMPVFKVLAKLKGLRGTAFDLFGYTAERRTERALIGEYEALVNELLRELSPANHPLAVKLASLPDEIRGYGHIKDASIEKTRRRQAEMLHQWRNAETLRIAAE